MQSAADVTGQMMTKSLIPSGLWLLCLTSSLAGRASLMFLLCSCHVGILLHKPLLHESLPVQRCLLRNDGRGQEAVAITKSLWLFVRLFLASSARVAVRVSIYRYERDNVPNVSCVFFMF